VAAAPVEALAGPVRGAGSVDAVEDLCELGPTNWRGVTRPTLQVMVSAAERKPVDHDRIWCDPHTEFERKDSPAPRRL